MEKGPIPSLMERNIRVSGSKTNSMDRVFTTLLTAIVTMVFGIKTISKDRAQCITTMVTSMLATGNMISVAGKESTSLRMEPTMKGLGKTI